MPDEPNNSASSPNGAPTAMRAPGASEFEARMGAFIGPRWEKSYRKKLAVFVDDPSFVPTWNWSAFFALPFWFLYRKMYLWFAAFFFVPTALLNWLVPDATTLTPDDLLKPENQQALLMIAAVQLSARIAAGGVSNWLLFRRGRTAIRVVGMQPMPAEDSMQLLRRVGGTSGMLTYVLVGVFIALGVANAMGTLAPR
jgi:hypothetical protein